MTLWSNSISAAETVDGAVIAPKTLLGVLEPLGNRVVGGPAIHQRFKQYCIALSFPEDNVVKTQKFTLNYWPIAKFDKL